MKNINLTDKELVIAEWAIAPMEDFFEQLVEEGEIEKMPEMPKISGNTLLLPEDEGVIVDLLYRVEEQYTDMVYAEPGINKKKELNTAESLADKIKSI